MPALWIWGAAAVLYAAFSLWYSNWGGPLSRAEIEGYMPRLVARPEGRDPERMSALRAFLESDDGGELFMVNLVRLQPEPVALPGSAEMAPASAVLERYTRPFLGGALRRAAHPVFFGPAAGSYLEHWGVEPDPGWTFSGIVRYRSRRDLIELATDPGFSSIHAYKLAAIANTLAFPVAPSRLHLGPKLLVPLVLALSAALAHLALVTYRGGV
jgi:hypothetical protein